MGQAKRTKKEEACKGAYRKTLQAFLFPYGKGEELTLQKEKL
ncbi:hypothetical protein Q787_01495 [Ornithobacterium rhinotracheale H06-030791]|nr:hypothetical protein Q785_01525 [Ornithobacterium rhinotracheale ORT-UMN 88]KGB67839.1 hypothetical protein Q787_01495 [Ornithobacterium rhinotracheale H06-030791]